MPALAPLIIQLLVEFGPTLTHSIVSLWHKWSPDNVELAEWKALLATVGTSYDDYIKNAKASLQLPIKPL